MSRTHATPPQREESSYRVRRVRGAEFFTSRSLHDELALVIKRFPPGPGAPEGGRPFVLVHGIGVSSRYFGPLAAELAKRGTVYAVDLPGYGASPNPGRDVTIADHAAVLASHLDAAGIENPVLVGHSMGVQVITQLAVDCPALTDRLVLIGPTMDPRARTVPKASFRLLRDILREPLRSNLVVLSDYLFRCGVPYYFRQLPHLIADRLEDRLPQLTAKTMVIRGDNDPIAPAKWATAVAAHASEAMLHTVTGPHVVMFTDPVSVAALIEEHSRP